jgi:ABC-2 type transport system permease protein
LEVPASQADAGPPLRARSGGPPEAVDETPVDDGPAPRAAGGRAKVTRVVSGEVGLGHRLVEIWRSRELLKNLVRTEIRVKYKSSFLGILWSMISPAITLVVFWLVFTFLAKNGIPNFVIFLFAGLLLWNLFQIGVLTGTGSVVGNAGLVKKVSFPREILPLASIGSAIVYFFFQTIVMVLFLVIFRWTPDFAYLPLLLVALVAGILVAAAFSIFFSAVNVHLRDTQHLVEVLLTVWFWACPIVYSFQMTIAKHLGPRHLDFLYFLNPLTPLILTFQRTIYAKVVVRNTVTHQLNAVLPPHGMGWYAALDFGVLAVSVVMVLVALVVFGRLEGNFAEDL